MKSPDTMTREELEKEVTDLRHEVGILRKERRHTAIRETLMLPPGEASFLMALYDAKGETVFAWNVLAAAPVYVSRLRKRLGRTAIDTIRSRGWAITPVGIATVDHALQDAGVTL